MRYTKNRDEAAVQKMLKDAIDGEDNGPPLDVNGLIVANVNKNWLVMMDGKVRDNYSELPGQVGMGVYIAGELDSDNQIVCVSGMSGCGAFIAVRGNKSGKALNRFLAIHLGGAGDAITLFEKVIKDWVKETSLQGELWVVGATSLGEKYEMKTWEESVKDYCGLDDEHIFYYGVAGQIGIQRNGRVGEPRNAAPSSNKKSCCCLPCTIL